jgi:glycosyltransferase involved in cell wall biosynthesis
MEPLVSILIPAYNAQEWIADTIQSALAQTWFRKEIIVVDDGSTDQTVSIIRKNGSSAVRIIKQERGGACRARNRALSECQGDYIQWLDADDLLARDKIEQQLAVAKILRDPDLLLTSTWGRFYYRPSKAIFRPTPLWGDFDAVEWLIMRLSNPWMIPNSSWLVSRDLTDKAGPWDERLAKDQDGEYFCRIVSLSRYVKFVPEAHCYYRMANPYSISRSKSRKAWESLFLSADLSTRHVLMREDSERVRTACAKFLNITASIFEGNAADLTYRLQERINQLGGEVAPESTSRKYACVQAILGKGKAQGLKEMEWQIRRRIYSSWDHCMAMVFGRSL